MDSFQRIVTIIAIINLVICFIVIAVVLLRSKRSEVWPPMVGDCPDYWIDASGNGSQCINVKDLGTCNSNPGPDGHSTMDFSVSPYTGSSGLCGKYLWANACGVTWDGITYGNGGTSPCDDTTTTTT